MGVDNNGILFLGLKDSEIDLIELDNLDLDYYESESAEEEIEAWGRNQGCKDLTAQLTNIYADWDVLIGFELANSGSYGYREVEGLIDLIEVKTKTFKELFGLEPKIFIMNYLW